MSSTNPLNNTTAPLNKNDTPGRHGLSPATTTAFSLNGTRFSLGSQRSGKSGGKYSKIMMHAASATPSPTSVPNCPKPGSPPRFSTRNAQIVVVAAQKILGAI